MGGIIDQGHGGQGHIVEDTERKWFHPQADGRMDKVKPEYLVEQGMKTVWIFLIDCSKYYKSQFSLQTIFFHIIFAVCYDKCLSNIFTNFHWLQSICLTTCKHLIPWKYPRIIPQLRFHFITDIQYHSYNLILNSFISPIPFSQHHSVPILGLHPTNERRCYTVTPSLIGWVQI